MWRDWVLLIIICALFVMCSPELHAGEVDNLPATSCSSDKKFLAQLEMDLSEKIWRTWHRAKIHRSKRSATAAAARVIRQNFACPRELP